METSTFDEENNDTLYIAKLAHNNYENYEENELENDENNDIQEELLQNTRVRGTNRGRGLVTSLANCGTGSDFSQSEPTNAKKFQGYGYKLDSRERELESQCNELLVETEFFANKCSEFRNAKVLAEARSDMLNKELEKKNDKILSFQEEIDQLINAKNKGDLNIKQFKKEIKQLKKEIKRFKKEIIELQNKNTSLISQDSLKELSLTGYRTKYYAKMEEANSLQSKIKLLEEKLFSACEDVSKKEFDSQLQNK
ncbi:hypothetical protein Glove_290g109 [Diversispora epigaea]|uniref:Uncharacterized protein n=1 Tax=Diversispora epigaea TaxID=1348612 RepID=A0A397I4B1_9GLOM|nr:hypothetical protein Glove_290g109 [Diversispora epigaea]